MTCMKRRMWIVLTTGRYSDVDTNGLPGMRALMYTGRRVYEPVL